ncbi:MAG: SET domain-containing protein-lysine N-methyltransferase [bacterium]|nr:SET domain-containing protein-lysine N-methyltransferase [bacterium]
MKTTALYAIQKSRPGLGHGLFATQFIRKGVCIVEYTGRKISTKIADTLGTRYLFEIDNEWTIDGSVRSNIARYINHSCDPNCDADIVDDRILISAVRDIEKGEELSFDYGEEYLDEFIRPFGCKCASCALGRAIVAV